MELDASLEPSEVGPEEQGRARKKPIPEAKRSTLRQDPSRAETTHRLPKEFFKEGRAVTVRVRKRRAARCDVDAQMHQLAQTTRQPVADLRQRIGSGQLREEHRD